METIRAQTLFALSEESKYTPKPGCGWFNSSQAWILQNFRSVGKNIIYSGNGFTTQDKFLNALRGHVLPGAQCTFDTLLTKLFSEQDGSVDDSFINLYEILNSGWIS